MILKFQATQTDSKIDEKLFHTIILELLCLSSVFCICYVQTSTKQCAEN